MAEGMRKRKGDAPQAAGKAEAGGELVRLVPEQVRFLVPYAIQALDVACLVYAQAKPVVSLLIKLVRQCPDDLLIAATGFIMCFFGGTFTALIAAVEAFRMTGWAQTRRNVVLLYEEMGAVASANEADQAADKDGDGKSDVAQKTPAELMLHKTHLVLVTVKDPEKVSSALKGLATSCLSVVAVLRVQFAKTVTLAVSISESLRSLADTWVRPTAMAACPAEYKHWVPTFIDYVCKTIAISVAWYIAKVMSAIHSGVKGGLMCARGIFDYLNKTGKLQLKHEDTYIDEVAGWTLALVGVYWQVKMGFGLPFPLNLLLLPFTILEWFIIYVVSDPDIVVA